MTRAAVLMFPLLLQTIISNQMRPRRLRGASYRQFHWIGHVIRTPNDRIPKQVFFGQLAAGKQLPGGPMKHYKDRLKENLKKCDFQPKSLCEEPLDRNSWLFQCKEATAKFEANRVAALEMKCAAHKQAPLPSMDVAVWPCSRCSRSALPELDSLPTNTDVAVCHL